MNTLNSNLEEFYDLMCIRLNKIADKTKVNEFSGKSIISIKSIMLQILQNSYLDKTRKKTVCLDILIAIEEINK